MIGTDMSTGEYRCYSQPLDDGRHIMIAHVVVADEGRADLLIEAFQDWLTSEGGWQSKVN